MSKWKGKSGRGTVYAKVERSGEVWRTGGALTKDRGQQPPLSGHHFSFLFTLVQQTNCYVLLIVYLLLLSLSLVFVFHKKLSHIRTTY